MPVYLARVGDDGPVKIGCSFDFEYRLRAISYVVWKEMRLLRLFEGSFDHERKLHQRFSHLNIGREWYKFAEEMLTEDFGLRDITHQPRELTIAARSMAPDNRKRSETLRSWMTTNNMDEENLAKLVGKSRGIITNYLRHGDIPTQKIRPVLSEISGGQLDTMWLLPARSAVQPEPPAPEAP